MGIKLDDNDGKHIDEIVENVSCNIHNAEKGVPCFYIQYNSGKKDFGPGVCGPRIRKAGFNGEIQPSSLSQSVRNAKRSRS